MSGTDNQFDIMGGSDAPGMNEASGTGGGGEPAVSVEPGTSGSGEPAGNEPKAAGTGSAPGAAGPKAAEWTRQLSREIRDGEAFGNLASFKSVSDLAKAYTDLQAKQGSGGGVDYAALFKDEGFWAAMGVPKADEAYGIEDDDALGLAAVARGINMTRGQAQAVAKHISASLEGAAAERAAKQLEALTAATAEQTRLAFPAVAEKLKSEFGKDAALYYNKAAAGLIDKLRVSGLGADPRVARALCALGRDMTEGSTGGGSGGGGGAGRSKTWAEGGKLL